MLERKLKMINCLFFAIGFVLFFTFSFGGMAFSSIHRSFQNIDRSVLEVSVVTIDESGDDTRPYFNEEVLEEYVSNYLKDNIGKYSTNYQSKILYFDTETRQINTNHHANGVRISISTKINMFYTYQKSREFTIDERGKINE